MSEVNKEVLGQVMHALEYCSWTDPYSPCEHKETGSISDIREVDAIMLIIDQQVAEAELNGRIDEILRIKQDGETVISSPDDSWEGPSLEQRLVDLQATLKAQRGGLTP